jgi:hypothetical protein
MQARCHLESGPRNPDAVAGNGLRGYSGDGGSALHASLYDPFGVAVDSSGNLFIADANNSRIRKITPDGTISTIASGPPLSQPQGIAVDAAGNVYFSDLAANQVWEVSDGSVLIIAGSLNQPQGVAVDGSGNVSRPSGRWKSFAKRARRGCSWLRLERERHTAGAALDSPLAGPLQGGSEDLQQLALS